MSESPIYRCPHCDAALDHVVVIETIPLVPDDGYRRHPVTPLRLAAVTSAHQRGGVTAVMADLNVSKSQAYRLIAQANGA